MKYYVIIGDGDCSYLNLWDDSLLQDLFLSSRANLTECQNVFSARKALKLLRKYMKHHVVDIRKVKFEPAADWQPSSDEYIEV